MTPDMIDQSVIAKMQEHAIRCAPNESCGIIVDLDYIPLENMSQTPRHSFQLPNNYMTAYGQVQAIVHSHVAPLYGPQPSSLDIQNQMVTAVPWAIIPTDGKAARAPVWFGDFLLDEPFFDENGNWIGRPFMHGVRDCYHLIRAWYWQNRQVKLPQVPRDIEWWVPKGDQPAQNLFAEGFERAGFVALSSPSLAIEGDVLLMKFARSKVYNHGAIFLGKGLVAHHPGMSERVLSRREPIGSWARYIHNDGLALRYVGS